MILLFSQALAQQTLTCDRGQSVWVRLPSKLLSPDMGKTVSKYTLLEACYCPYDYYGYKCQYSLHPLCLHRSTPHCTVFTFNSETCTIPSGNLTISITSECRPQMPTHYFEGVKDLTLHLFKTMEEMQSQVQVLGGYSKERRQVYMNQDDLPQIDLKVNFSFTYKQTSFFNFSKDPKAQLVVIQHSFSRPAHTRFLQRQLIDQQDLQKNITISLALEALPSSQGMYFYQAYVQTEWFDPISVRSVKHYLHDPSYRLEGHPIKHNDSLRRILISIAVVVTLILAMCLCDKFSCGAKLGRVLSCCRKGKSVACSGNKYQLLQAEKSQTEKSE